MTFSYVWAPKGFSAGNSFTNAALGLFTRHWTVSGVERFQSGPYTTLYATSDTNGDGAANDRPTVSNPNAPFTSVAIDSTLLTTGAASGIPTAGVQGVYYDLTAYNSSTNTAATKPRNIISPANAHFVIGRGQQFLASAVSRNSFLQPGYQQHDVAVEKGFGMSYLHLDRGQLVLRAEANDIGNHNNVAPVGTNVQLFGAASQLNTTTARTVSARSLVLWATFKF